MIIQKFINISPETKTNIDLIKIYIAFIISFIISFLSIFYNTNYYLQICLNIFTIYVSIDVFFSTPDLVLHHIFGFFACQFITENNINFMINNNIYKTFFNTELSTIFLSIKLLIDWYKKDIEQSKYFKIIKIYYTINDIVFFYLFFKLRIYDFFYNIIQNKKFYDIVYYHIHNSIIKNIKIYTSIYGLFILNIYWFLIICKKLYKQVIVKLFPSIDNELNAKYIININYLIIIYYYLKNIKKYILSHLCYIFIYIFNLNDFYSKEYKNFNLLSNFICLLDMIVVIYYANTFIQKINILLIKILIVIISNVKPFYKLNSVFLHMLLIFQTLCVIEAFYY